MIKMDIEYPSNVCLIYKGDDCIGYTHSWQEAEEICKKNSEFQWERVKKKTINLIEKLQQLTIWDV